MTFALDEEQLQIQGLVRRVAREKVAPRANDIDRSAEYPQDMFELLRELGLFALPFPQSHGGTGSTLSACVVVEAGNGVIRSRLGGHLSPEAWEGDIILPLREHVAAEGGSVVVEAAPRALKERLDVWGPIEPGVLGIMKRLKAEFDPRAILNPGRFVDRI